MKKIYMTPTIEEMKLATEQLIAASGLDSEEFQDTEVDEAWSRMSFFIFTSLD